MPPPRRGQWVNAALASRNRHRVRRHSDSGSLAARKPQALIQGPQKGKPWGETGGENVILELAVPLDHFRYGQAGLMSDPWQVRAIVANLNLHAFSA